MRELRIHTKIQSHYRVFDASGRLPFNVVFGLCRRSSADIDPRPSLLDVGGSVLDVPYALTHGLLTLQEQDPAKQWVEVDLSGLNQVVAKEGHFLSLSSPVGRTEHWRDAFTIYCSSVDSYSDFVSILQSKKKYRIKLLSEDLHVKRWTYSDQKKFNDKDDISRYDSEKTGRLINSKSSAGNAQFTFLNRLCWPPRIEMKMRLCPFPPSSSPPSVTALEILAINTGASSVTIQTKGHQNFLIPWGPFQPEDPLDPDNRMRILHPMPHRPPTTSLQIIACETGEVVRGNAQRRICLLADSHAFQHPKAEDTLTLKPGDPVIRNVDISALLNGLADGHYQIRMHPTGCWWCYKGEKKTALIPPLMLESQDEVELSIQDGKVNQKV